MCGVIAYRSVGKVISDGPQMLKLLQESSIRGLHGFGFANGRKVARFSNLSDLTQSVPKELPQSFIAHCRYSTSGDWRIPSNNQPIELDGHFLSFNGCIDMGTKGEFSKRYGKTYQTENDGEIFLRKVVDGEDWENWVGFGNFSFAGAIMFPSNEIFLLRNKSRPLWTVRRKDSRWAFSTKDIGIRAGFEKDEIKEVPCGIKILL